MYKRQGLDKVPVKTVITTELGDLFPFPKRPLVNFVVKHVKKMVPAWRIPGAVPFRQALSQGAGQTLTDVPLNHDDIAFLQYTGGTTGVSKGAMPVSYTHLDVYKRQPVARMPWKFSQYVATTAMFRLNAAISSAVAVMTPAPTRPCLLYTSRCV